MNVRGDFLGPPHGTSKHADPPINIHYKRVERVWSEINKYVNGISRKITEMYEH